MDTQHVAVPTTYATRLALPRDFFGGDIVGDLGVEWPIENADKVAETFQKLIDNGQATFYLIEKTQGLLRNKTTITVVDGKADMGPQLAGRQVYVKNTDIKALIDSGVASVSTFSGVTDFKITGKTAKTGQEAATNDTTALGPRGGG